MKNEKECKVVVSKKGWMEDGEEGKKEELYQRRKAGVKGG